MTTNIKVQSHNYPAMVQVIDTFEGKSITVETRILFPEDGEVLFYCTTTRQVRVTDLECEDARVLEAEAKRAPVNT